jgi:hypothetical protein
MLKREQRDQQILCVGTFALIKTNLSEYGADAFRRADLTSARENIEQLLCYKKDLEKKESEIAELEESLGIDHE